MVAHSKRRRSGKPITTWQAQFLAMLPAIETHAKISFRHLDPENRAEMVQEVICNACCAFKRLVELNKTDLAYAGVLARYGVAQAKDGRRVGNRLNCKDVLSPYCHVRKKIAIERLDRYDSTEDGWQEILVEDRHAGPFDIVRTKLDFAAWLHLLPIKLRRIAKTLANGERTRDVAVKFNLSQGRISQIRSELLASWRRFVGDAESSNVAASAA